MIFFFKKKMLNAGKNSCKIDVEYYAIIFLRWCLRYMLPLNLCNVVPVFSPHSKVKSRLWHYCLVICKGKNRERKWVRPKKLSFRPSDQHILNFLKVWPHVLLWKSCTWLVTRLVRLKASTVFSNWTFLTCVPIKYLLQKVLVNWQLIMVPCKQ